MTVDVVVVGAGQAGLAAGHQLQERGVTPLLLDAGARVGDVWRRRWDSLTLFTPRRYDGLPGMAMPGDPDGHPGKDEVADYLEAYALRFALPVCLDSPVTEVTAASGGGFIVRTPTTEHHGHHVVVATGPFTTPAVPAFATGLDSATVQLHSSAYRRPSQLPNGHVIVVGGGNTGVQIADELSATRAVTLAVGELDRGTPQRILGRELFWWLERLGLMDAPADSHRGRAMRRRNTIIGTDVRDLLQRVRRLPRAVDAVDGALAFADGTRERPAAVVWATGFRPSYPWLRLPVLDDGGAIRQRDGRTPVRGLSVLGQPWQRNRGSALLGWVGRDAAVLAARVAADRSRPAAVAA